MVNCVKIIFICLRHGINPFGKVLKNIDKMAQRFTDEEKRVFIDICKCKQYFIEHLYR